LVEDQPQINGSHAHIMDGAGKKISAKDVRNTIKAIQQTGETTMEVDSFALTAAEQPVREEEEDFVLQPSTTDHSAADLPTLKTLSQQPSAAISNLFSGYTFFLSRETPRHLMEFVIRSFGGRVGWTLSQGGGSPLQEYDESVTHVIIDRPPQIPPQNDATQAGNECNEESETGRKLRLKRKYVQPQWVVDCINKGKILLEGPYEQGKTLPPHLSPFGEEAGAYDPEEDLEQAEAESSGRIDDEDEEDDVNVSIADPQDEEALRVAELQAEAAGIDYNAFNKAIKKQIKKKPSQVNSTEKFVT
jgi:pescadillo protein